mgnify:CR=1 FL=1
MRGDGFHRTLRAHVALAADAARVHVHDAGRTVADELQEPDERREDVERLEAGDGHRQPVAGRERLHAASAGQQVELILDRSPLYAESGGQIADIGTITGPRMAHLADALPIRMLIRADTMMMASNRG